MPTLRSNYLPYLKEETCILILSRFVTLLFCFKWTVYCYQKCIYCFIFGRYTPHCIVGNLALRNRLKMLQPPHVSRMEKPLWNFTNSNFGLALTVLKPKFWVLKRDWSFKLYPFRKLSFRKLNPNTSCRQFHHFIFARFFRTNVLFGSFSSYVSAWCQKFVQKTCAKTVDEIDICAPKYWELTRFSSFLWKRNFWTLQFATENI